MTLGGKIDKLPWFLLQFLPQWVKHLNTADATNII